MRIAILTLSPHLSSLELAAAIQLAGMEVFDFSPDGPAESWSTADGFILLADSEVMVDNPAAQSLTSALHAQNLKGKAILGLGYGGAKLLADIGLVPGIYKNLPCLSVGETGSSISPEEAWIRLTEDYQFNAFTQGLAPRQVLPVQRRTRAEFIIAPGLLAELRGQGQTVFVYCDAEGQTLTGNAIAAVSNKAGNVMALLAYPETASAGEPLFQALRAHLASGHVERVEPLCYWPRK